MDIRTKLVFAYVATALGCMLALGTATYVEVRALLRNTTLEQLDGLAESRKAAVEEVLAEWGEAVSLIASRPDVVEGLQDYVRDGGSGQSDRIARALRAEVAVSRAVTIAAIYDLQGDRVAWAADTPRQDEDRVPGTLSPPAEGFAYRGAETEQGSAPRVFFSTPVEAGGEGLGTLYVELIAEELLDLAGRYGGLGMTGEALVLLRTGDEEAVVLHPVRHGDTGPVTLELGDPSADPFARALAGPGASLWDGATDYRGVAVWAATRHVPETSWGVVVKVDAQEEEAPIADFRARLARLGLSISAFAILLGTILGLRFAKPIHDLAEVAEEIKSGELSARAKVTRQDEIGVLARTFNEMADELEARMVSLQEYRKFFDVSLDMLCVAGTDGYFKRTNPSFERILGWPEEELLARPFLEITHPDDIEATLRELEKLAEGIPTVSFENRFRCADGTYKCLLWTSYPDPDTGLLYAIAHEVVEGAKNRG